MSKWEDINENFGLAWAVWALLGIVLAVAYGLRRAAAAITKKTAAIEGM